MRQKLHHKYFKMAFSGLRKQINKANQVRKNDILIGLNVKDFGKHIIFSQLKFHGDLA